MPLTALASIPLTQPQPRLHQSSSLGAEGWTQLVNQAGRQRMLSQRIILHAVLASQGDEGARQTAHDALALFERSHETLSRGSPELPMPADRRLVDAFHGPQGADTPIREFIGLAHRALQPAGRLGPHTVPALPRLTAQATPVLNLLQRLTQLYETLALESAKTRRRQSADLIDRIQRVAREARIVTFNARVGAARAGAVGREFAAVADILARITEEVEHLAKQAGQMNA
ncbi:MAG: type IV pili methyl-accepting chemotaxis transducer N-terminal domain-containing protein [Vitreoscilla sp.]|nr:type IV pili methyl-accepting chemotaxis transducer N-terminal domain-containing protein [Vitreoscilla sp.]